MAAALWEGVSGVGGKTHSTWKLFFLSLSDEVLE